MNTHEFLRKILPEQGLKVLATIKPVLDKDGNPILKSDGSKTMTVWHKTFNTIDELANRIKLLSHNGEPLYMAMGGFDPEKSFIDKVSRAGKPYKGFSRSANFTQSFKAFWIDIDCGKDKAEKGEGYVDQLEAIKALKKFVADLNFPKPTVVDSGGGLHCYWALAEEIDAERWQKIATCFDATIKFYGLKADPACTADKARILRPVGTINHKYNKPVRVIKEMPSISFEDFMSALKPYYMANKEKIKQFKVKPASTVDKKSFQFDDKPRAVKPYIARCQVAKFAAYGDTPVSEPVWRGIISVMRLCTNGEKHIETLRAKQKARFPDTTRFDEDRTQEKLNWFIDHDIGPFFCDTFRAECPNLCENCPYQGTINSPIKLTESYEEIEPPRFNIDLGVVEQPVSEKPKREPPKKKVREDNTAPELNVELESTGSEIPNPPYPYKRTAQGLVTVDNDREQVFFRGDMFPLMNRFIETIDGERQTTVKFMLRIGFAGEYQEISFPMSNWYAQDRIKQKLGAAGISISEKNMQTLIAYMRKYIDEISDKMKDIRQLQHFGWDDENNFLLGDKLIGGGGMVTIQPHATIKHYTRYFEQRGSLDEWKRLMDRLGQLNATAQQICVLSGFGSTLMQFTNYNGIWLHLVTKPGYGKTTTQEMMNGIWGKPQDLLLNAKDTLNAIEERFGRWGNISVAIDEVSNLDPMVASELLLGVTQGRTKQRLDTNMRERVNNLTWKLMVLSSGNFSLIDRINTKKEDVAAEISRTLEFRLPKPTLSVHEGELLIKKPIRENYGLAGPEWLSHITRIPHFKIQEMIDVTVERFSKDLNATSEERFWITACAVIYVTGTLTNKIGLTNWDLQPIYDKLCEIVNFNRGNKTTYEFSATDVLASFLADNSRNTVVTDIGVGENAIMVRLTPSGPLNVRYEQDTGLIYIRTAALKEYCAKREIGFNTVKSTLESNHLLQQSQVRAVLSRGLPQSTGRTYCLVVKADDISKATLDSLVEANGE